MNKATAKADAKASAPPAASAYAEAVEYALLLIKKDLQRATGIKNWYITGGGDSKQATKDLPTEDI